MKWLIGGVVALFVVPPVLRHAAKNPQLLHKGADAIDTGKRKAVEYGKRGYTAAREAVAARRAFGSLFQ